MKTVSMPTMMYGGKKYTIWERYHTKAQAEAAVKIMRGRDFLARVYKSENGVYYVLVALKKR